MDPTPITKCTRNRSSKVKKQNKKPHRKKDKNNNPNHKSNYVWLLFERRQSFITLLRSCWCSNLDVALVLFCRLPTTRGCLFSVQTKGFKLEIARCLLHRYSKCMIHLFSESGPVRFAVCFLTPEPPDAAAIATTPARERDATRGRERPWGSRYLCVV
jgi:hypothetical protein